MNDELLPYAPRHGFEAQRGYPEPKRKWDRKIPMCFNCGERPIYLPDIETMDWCEHCLWDLIKDDQALVAVLQQEIHEEDQENASNESDQ